MPPLDNRHPDTDGLQQSVHAFWFRQVEVSGTRSNVQCRYLWPLPRDTHSKHIKSHRHWINEGPHLATCLIAPIHGNLGDMYSEVASQIKHLHVEGKTIHHHQMKENTGHWRAKGLETALRVGQPHVGQRAHEPVKCATHHDTPLAVAFDN